MIVSPVCHQIQQNLILELATSREKQQRMISTDYFFIINAGAFLNYNILKKIKKSKEEVQKIQVSEHMQ